MHPLHTTTQSHPHNDKQIYVEVAAEPSASSSDLFLVPPFRRKHIKINRYTEKKIVLVIRKMYQNAISKTNLKMQLN